MANFRALLDKNFKGDSLKGSPPIRLTIKQLKAAEVGMDKVVKPVVYFIEDPRGLVLNNTKFNDLSEANGGDNDEGWVGCIVELSHDPTVEYKGKKCGGVGMKVITPAKK